MLVILKNLQSLSNREIIYMLYDRSFKIAVKNIKKYKEFERELIAFIQKEISSQQPKEEKVCIEREIIKFCITETELLMECGNDEEINDKLTLVKNLCRFVTADYETTMVEIKWGERSDFEGLSKYVGGFIRTIKEETIIEYINEEHTDN